MPQVRCAAINIENVKRRLQLDENIWRRAVPEAIMVATSQLVPAYVEMHVPRGATGNLQDSANIKITPTSLTLTFDSLYAKYVNDGVPPSSGRYIPMIGKRLVNVSTTNPSIGMHPGFEGRHFFEAIANDLKVDLRSVVYTIVKREWIR